MARAQAPKFGDWGREEIPYTIYFDNARKSKGTDQTHQKDLQESLKPETKKYRASEAKLGKHEQRSARDEGEMRRSGASPLHPNTVGRHKPVIDSSDKWHHHADGYENTGLRNSSESPQHRHSGLSAGDTPRRVSRKTVGPDRSVDHSPMHPHSQIRSGGRSGGVSSPAWERKAALEGSHSHAPSTPGRSRLRSVTRGDDSPDRGPVVPKFGDWDETDPATAEGYSNIFNRVIEEKHKEIGKIPVMPAETPYTNGQTHHGNDNPKGCCCFPWGKR